jgi:hypothetical protein
MGQVTSREADCEALRLAAQVAERAYGTKRSEHERLTKGEQAVKNLDKVNALGREVARLEAEMKARQRAYNDCLQRQRGARSSI